MVRVCVCMCIYIHIYIHICIYIYIIYNDIYNGILLSNTPKNEILSSATTWVNLEGIIPSEIRQKKTIWHGINYIWTFKK